RGQCRGRGGASGAHRPDPRVRKGHRRPRARRGAVRGLGQPRQSEQGLSVGLRRTVIVRGPCDTMFSREKQKEQRRLRSAQGFLAAAASLPFLLVGAGLSWLENSTGAEAFPAAFDPAEGHPGGEATSLGSTDNTNAFSHSSANMGFARELDFKIGNAIFRKLWVSAPASTKSSDGLGPLYNARSCQTCHLKDGRGHPPNGNWPDDNAVSMLLRLSIPPQTDADRELLASGRASVIPEPTYGTQLQDLAIAGHKGEGHVHI